MSRLTFLVIIATFTFTGVIMASGVRSQNLKTVRLSVDVKNATLQTVLEQIKQKSGFSFVYTEEIGNIRGISLSANGETLYEILKEISRKKGVLFDQSNYLIAVVKAPQKPVQQPGRISGKVIDERGEGLPGASIRIVETGQATQSNVDGTYVIVAKPGKYTLEFSYISFQKQQITGVIITEGKTTPLGVAMKADAKGLQEVVVTSSYKKASINNLYAQQRNGAGLSDGISAEQISATPDRHVGETLSRITGVSTTEGKRVVVRGIAERYNVATLNGSTLPSTSVQERNFEFDLIPTNLVDNIIVAKSITPDMPYSFAGGLVQITTKAVPTENFMSFNAGVSYNDRTMGKDFLGYKRSKYEYLGYDDGGRNHFPADLVNVEDNFSPIRTDQENKLTAAQVAEQNRRIGGTERFGARAYSPSPSQNYQFSGGRVYALSKTKVRNLGFVGSLSYRNTQRNNLITNMRRGQWSQQPTYGSDPDDVNTGNRYIFNTTLGALLNAGFHTEKNEINMYNLYTRIFDDQFNRITGWTHEMPKGENNLLPVIEEDDRPKFSDLLQNKLSGKHTIGAFTVDWNAARTHLKQVEKDAVSAGLQSKTFANEEPAFNYYPGGFTNPGWGPLNRGQFTYKERVNEAAANLAYSFRMGKTSHILKTGYNYLYKHVSYHWVVLPIVTYNFFATDYSEIPIQEYGNHMNMDDPKTSMFYNVSVFNTNIFEGKSNSHGTYIMLDHKLSSKLRLVWGSRAEYFKLDTLKNPASLLVDKNVELLLGERKDWYFLPSANITYSPIDKLNIRTSYGKAAVRPGVMENSRFSRYDPNYGSQVRSSGVTTTLIDNYDAKIEWFPGAGELISAGYFYKYFDKPAEYYRLNNNSGGNPYISIANSDWAKVKGWEFELRKNMGFVNADWLPLSKIYMSGNLALQNSEVRAREIDPQKTGENGAPVFRYLKYPRELYGQVPILYNLGLQYAGDRLGLNITYNHAGYKTFVTSSEPALAEYERPRGQLDAQLSYHLKSKRFEAKLNMSNLTDAPHRFFINDDSTYEIKESSIGQYDLEWGDRYQYKDGFSEKYEKGYTDKETGGVIGDRNSFTRYMGRTFSLSLSYNF